MTQPRLWAEEIGDAFGHVHGVVVVDHETGQRRRRVFLRLEGAERALRRAQARGDHAAVALVELRPMQIEDVTTP